HTVEGGRCRVPAVSLTGYCAVSGEFKTRPCFAWRVAHLCAFAKVGTEGVSSHILLPFTMLPSSCAHPPEALLRSRRSAFRNVPLLSSDGWPTFAFVAKVGTKMSAVTFFFFTMLSSAHAYSVETLLRSWPSRFITLQL